MRRLLRKPSQLWCFLWNAGHDYEPGCRARRPVLWAGGIPVYVVCNTCARVKWDSTVAIGSK